MEATVKLTPLQKKAWLLSAGGVALDGFDLFIMGVALPLLLHEFQGYPAWITGLIASAAIVGAIFGALFGGLLTDHFGRKKLYTWDLVGFIVFAVLSAFSWSVDSRPGWRWSRRCSRRSSAAGRRLLRARSRP